ncbi:MAG: DUF302 domain-containing protein [Gammaproteobacteria bacterium]|jgi:hypothetical protein
MSIKIILWYALAITILFTHSQQGWAQTNAEHEKEIYSVTVQGDFNEYKELLKLAISGRGIKISNTSFISHMLQRTKEAVGADRDIFVNAEAIEFCSATLSREMMAADPHNILYCPYIIYIYEVAGKPGVIHLAYRKLPIKGSPDSRRALKKVNKLLKEIIAETVE